ncbi:glycoside hydrolase family 88 protein, partial [Paenibacillus sepulcri]|nr:glycoside hydrolase family 88 protein [Paenibacillus sepulcri]
RFAEGIFQHTVNSVTYQFPEQAWVDTMMMAGYFLIRMGALLERKDYLEDGLLQYHGHERCLQDGVTNLYYHGWDNLAGNHMSGIYWARGNAWAALTMAKALPHIHVTHPSFMMIEGSLRDQLSALVRLQSEEGMWHTVLTDDSSYLETSGSAGIAAALLHSGTLYNRYVNKSIRGIMERITDDGSVTGV